MVISSNTDFSGRAQKCRHVSFHHVFVVVEKTKQKRFWKTAFLPHIYSSCKSPHIEMLLFYAIFQGWPICCKFRLFTINGDRHLIHWTIATQWKWHFFSIQWNGCYSVVTNLPHVRLPSCLLYSLNILIFSKRFGHRQISAPLFNIMCFLIERFKRLFD